MLISSRNRGNHHKWQHIQTYIIGAGHGFYTEPNMPNRTENSENFFYIFFKPKEKVENLDRTKNFSDNTFFFFFCCARSDREHLKCRNERTGREKVNCNANLKDFPRRRPYGGKCSPDKKACFGWSGNAADVSPTATISFQLLLRYPSSPWIFFNSHKTKQKVNPFILKLPLLELVESRCQRLWQSHLTSRRQYPFSGDSSDLSRQLWWVIN